jgi:hypothetical protein
MGISIGGGIDDDAIGRSSSSIACASADGVVEVAGGGGDARCMSSICAVESIFGMASRCLASACAAEQICLRLYEQRRSKGGNTRSARNSASDDTTQGIGRRIHAHGIAQLLLLYR